MLSQVKHGKSRCRKLVFVWCIRDASEYHQNTATRFEIQQWLTVLTRAGHMEWISHALSKALELAPSNVEISIRIFVTAQNAESLAREGSWAEDESIHSSEGASPAAKTKPSSLLSFPAVQLAHGRPDLSSMLREEVEANTGRLSVTGTCLSLFAFR